MRAIYIILASCPNYININTDTGNNNGSEEPAAEQATNPQTITGRPYCIKGADAEKLYE